MSRLPSPAALLSALSASALAWGLAWAAQLGLGLLHAAGDLRAGTWLLERGVAGPLLAGRVDTEPALVALRHLAHVPALGDRPPLLVGWACAALGGGAALTAAAVLLLQALRGPRPAVAGRAPPDALAWLLGLALPLALAAGLAGSRHGLGRWEAALGLGAAALAVWAQRWRAPRALGLGLLPLALLAGSLAREDAAPPDPTPLRLSPPEPTGLPRPGRVILITVDTLRADHVGALGYRRDTTPYLDRMARDEAQLFTRAYASAPWTLPSVTSTFTSLPPPLHTVEDQNRRLAAGVPTLAGAFSAGGWRTAAFVTHIYVTSLFGLDQGFDEFFELNIDWGFAEGQQLRAEALNAQVFPWLAAHRDEPFFLYLHYFDPHWDYDPPPPWDRAFTDPGYTGPADGTWSFLSQYLALDRPMPPEDLQRVIDLYDAEIKYTDHHLHALFSELRRLGMWEDTLLVLSADHGEEFKEHGSVHHIRTLYEEMLHVPLLLRLPGGRPPSWPAQVHTRVRNLDIAPTLLTLAGLPLPSTFQGQDLLPLLRGQPGEDRTHFARSLRHRVDVVGLLAGPYKYIRRYAPGQSREELYDLGADPAEQHDLAPARAAELAALRAQVERWLVDARAQRVHSVAGEVRVELSAEQLEQLRELGYVE